MLTHLTLENFKAWRKADLAFGKVTGFFGQNSAGKSSLLHFLLMLKQTRSATDRGAVLNLGGELDFVSLGTFDDIAHHERTASGQSRRISWSLDWTLPEKGRLDLASYGGPPYHTTKIRAECEVGVSKGDLEAWHLQYGFDDVAFWLKKGAKGFQLGTNSPDFEFRKGPGRPKQLPGPVKTHLFPGETRTSYQNTDFLRDFEVAYERLMDTIYYLGPLRAHPRRDYHWSGTKHEDVGQRGERTVDAILAATRDERTVRLKPKGRGIPLVPFQEAIARWLKDLKLIHEFSVEEVKHGTNLYRALARTSASAPPTALPDVGFGVSQVLPALVLLYYVPEGATVLMEQPEIHLHPAVQSGLADLMLNVAEVRNVQIIVESHSEHLLRRLQRRVAEEKALAEDVKLYFVSLQRGRAQAADLLLNEYGEIENWPDHFFGDEMGEIAAIAKARLKRRMSGGT